jgi:hypothetical protein
MKRPGVAAIGGLVLLFALLLSACGIGANPDSFTVMVTNNTSRTIVDHTFFGAAYGTPDVSRNDLVITAKPGHSYGVTEDANQGTDPDRITSLSGKTLGCLPFQFSENDDSLEVKITQMVRCRDWGYKVNMPRDWPNPNY